MNQRVSVYAVFLAFVFFSERAFSFVCLSPGEFRNNFVFTPQVVNNSLIKKARTIGPITFPKENLTNPGIFGQSLVSFNGQRILLEATASNAASAVSNRRIEAFARGKLSLDFVVDCGNSTGETTTIAIKFKVQRVGRITTFLPGSTSSFGVSARIRDTVQNRDVDFRTLESTSVGNLLGNFKVVAKVPIPIPDIEGVELAAVETFVIQVRKGRIYRFEMFAAARSTAGYTFSIVPPFATANFRDPIIDVGISNDPGIEIVDFEMDVASDQSEAIAELQMIVESLREAITNLSNQVDGLDPEIGAVIADLQETIAIHDENILALQESLASQNSDIAGLEQIVEDQGGDIAALQEEQMQLRSDIMAIAAQLAGVEEQLENLGLNIDSLRETFDSHSHEYLTGEGAGHNNTPVRTSTPQ